MGGWGLEGGYFWGVEQAICQVCLGGTAAVADALQTGTSAGLGNVPAATVVGLRLSVAPLCLVCPQECTDLLAQLEAEGVESAPPQRPAPLVCSLAALECIIEVHRSFFVRGRAERQICCISINMNICIIIWTDGRHSGG